MTTNHRRSASEEDLEKILGLFEERQEGIRSGTEDPVAFAQGLRELDTSSLNVYDDLDNFVTFYKSVNQDFDWSVGGEYARILMLEEYLHEFEEPVRDSAYTFFHREEQEVRTKEYTKQYARANNARDTPLMMELDEREEHKIVNLLTELRVEVDTDTFANLAKKLEKFPKYIYHTHKSRIGTPQYEDDEVAGWNHNLGHVIDSVGLYFSSATAQDRIRRMK